MGRSNRGVALSGLFVLLFTLLPQILRAEDGCTVFGFSSDTPIVGDWNGDGRDEIGVHRGAQWDLDLNGNGTFDGGDTDRTVIFGLAGDIPVVGDWNGDGVDDVGIVRNANWHLDWNGNRVFDGCVIDRCTVYGFASDIPVVGDWNGDGRDQIGIFRDGHWALDLNGDGIWQTGIDGGYGFGLAGDTPVPGDWNGDGSDEIAVHRPAVWSLDINGNRAWDGIPPDDSIHFSNGAGTPVVGNWDGQGAASAGMVTQAQWAFDHDDNGVWDGCNRPPVASNDWATTDPGVAVTIDVTANDSDPDGDPVSLVQQPFIGNPFAQHGTVTRASDSSVIYTPDTGFTGQDSFRYRIWDGLGQFHSAIVTVTVVSNHPPVAVNDFAETHQGQDVEIDVLANDSDPDPGDSLSLPPDTTVSGPHHGTAGRISTTLMEYRPNPSFVGTDTFQYRVRDSSGAESIARVWVTVHAAPDEPEVTSVGPDLIPHRATTQITVTGLNFDNPNVYVGTIKENPNDPDRVFPTASLISVNPAGTSMQVEIDATANGIVGWYSLYVETAGGGTLGMFRVIPDEPVIDAWTPVEALVGDTYVLTVAGVNLDGATVTPSDPNIHILDLDNTDPEGIHGLLYVANGAPIGELDIEIERGGVGVMIPLQLFDSAKKMTKRSVRVDSFSTDSRGVPVNAPPIYLQDPSMPGGGQFGGGGGGGGFASGPGKALESSPNKGGPSICFSTTRTRVRSSSRVLVRFFDLDTLLPITQAVLDSLEVGDRINIGTTVVATWRTLIFRAHVNWCYGEGIDGFFCVSGEFGFMIPLFGGQVFRFDACFGIPGDPVITLSANGFLLNFEWTSDCNCVRVFDLFPNSQSGQRQGVLEIVDCGQARLGVETQGVVFDLDFDLEGTLGTISPVDCPPPPSNRFDIEVRAFIPVNHVSGFPTHCIDPITGLVEFYVFAGDDRDYAADPAPTVHSPPFRMEQRISVYANQDACQNGLCDQDGLVVGSGQDNTGISRAFSSDALLNQPLGKITDADYDGVEFDCELWVLSGQASTSGWRREVTRLDPHTVEVKLSAAAADPLVPAPDVNWDLVITIDESASPASYTIEGRHDCYPGYEVYINNHQVWGSMPHVHNSAFIGCCLASPIPRVTASCSGIVGEGAPCLHNRYTCIQ